MTETKPKRAHEFACTIGGDTKEAIVRHIYDLVWRLERDELSSGVMGGSDAGSIYAYRHDPTITHEGYFDLIEQRRKEIEAEH